MNFLQKTIESLLAEPVLHDPFGGGKPRREGFPMFIGIERKMMPQGMEERK